MKQAFQILPHFLLMLLLVAASNSSASTTPDLFTLVQEVIELRIEEASKPLQEIPQTLQDEIDAIKQEGLPQPPTLTKGEFESTINFNARVKAVRQDYQSAVADYHERTEAIRNKVEKFYNNIPQLPVWRRNKIIEESLLGILGNPQIENVRYDADTETFFLDITSDSPVADDYRIPMAIKEQIPNHLARAFKQNLQSEARPEVTFSLNDGNIAWAGAQVAVDGNYYPMLRLGEGESASITTQPSSYTPQRIGGEVQALLDLETIPGLSATEKGVQVQLSNNPELSQEQRRVLELRRELAERELMMSQKEQLAAEAQALKEKLRLLEQGDATWDDDLPQLLSQTPPEPADPKKWLFVVAISDYDEAPNVSFADRSGQAFVQAMQRAGVPKENTVQLIDQRATGTRITSKLRRTLNQLGPEDTLYFYYAGHGVPDRKNAASYLLPSDGDMGSYEDPKLETNAIYEMLAKSDVGRAVIFMDACFSGRADKDRLVFEGVAGIVMRQKVRIDPERITLMTAGKMDQFANQHEERGHRLFSYYLIKGMVESDFDLTQVAEYVQENVSRESRKLGITYTQEPEIYGRLN